MIGPGTGIAPMRALMQERKHQFEKSKSSASVRNTLFFGCKNKDIDYIYREEIENYAKDGTLTELHLAFSRDQASKVCLRSP